jgi:hypothetical protein
MGPRDKNRRVDEPPRGTGEGSTSVERDEQYDDTVADSFPASDPPPSPSIVGPPRKPERQPAKKA